MKHPTRHDQPHAKDLDALGLRAVYSIPELARTARVHRNRLRRMLEDAGVAFGRSGRTLLVPLSELESRIPSLWKSLLTIEAVRRGDDPGSGDAIGDG